MKRWFTVFTLIAVFMAAVLVGPTSSQAAPTQGTGPSNSCLNVRPSRWEFYRNTWTGWAEIKTTSRCNDFNVKISQFPCTAVVDAQYYKASTGRWIDAARGDVTLQPSKWDTPITSLLDNVRVRYRFYPSCSDDYVDVYVDA